MLTGAGGRRRPMTTKLDAHVGTRHAPGVLRAVAPASSYVVLGAALSGGHHRFPRWGDEATEAHGVLQREAVGGRVRNQDRLSGVLGRRGLTEAPGWNKELRRRENYLLLLLKNVLEQKLLHVVLLSQ